MAQSRVHEEHILPSFLGKKPTILSFHSWIAKSGVPQIAKSILWIDKAINVWKTLKNRFSQGDLFQILYLEDVIIIQKQGEIVTSYFTELRILWDELENYRPLP